MIVDKFCDIFLGIWEKLKALKSLLKPENPIKVMIVDKFYDIFLDFWKIESSKELT